MDVVYFLQFSRNFKIIKISGIKSHLIKKKLYNQQHNLPSEECVKVFLFVHVKLSNNSEH